MKKPENKLKNLDAKKLKDTYYFYRLWFSKNNYVEPPSKKYFVKWFREKTLNQFYNQFTGTKAWL